MQRDFDDGFASDGTSEPSPPALLADPLAGLVAGPLLTVDPVDDGWLGDGTTDADRFDGDMVDGDARPASTRQPAEVGIDTGVDADEVRRTVAELFAEQTPSITRQPGQRRPSTGQPPQARSAPAARRQRPSTPATGRPSGAASRASTGRARKKMSPAQVVIMVLIAIVLLFNVLRSLVEWIVNAFH